MTAHTGEPAGGGLESGAGRDADGAWSGSRSAGGPGGSERGERGVPPGSALFTDLPNRTCRPDDPLDAHTSATVLQLHSTARHSEYDSI